MWNTGAKAFNWEKCFPRCVFCIRAMAWNISGCAGVEKYEQSPAPLVFICSTGEKPITACKQFNCFEIFEWMDVLKWGDNKYSSNFRKLIRVFGEISWTNPVICISKSKSCSRLELIWKNRSRRKWSNQSLAGNAADGEQQSWTPPSWTCSDSISKNNEPMARQASSRRQHNLILNSSPFSITYHAKPRSFFIQSLFKTNTSRKSAVKCTQNPPNAKSLGKKRAQSR